MAALHRILLLLALVGCPISGARAGWVENIETTPESGIDIRIATAFEGLPRAGYLPGRVTITNGADRALSWDFTFSTTSGNDQRETMTRSLSAAAGQTVSHDVLIPICPSNRMGGGYRSAAVSVSGPGVRVPGRSLPNARSSGKTETAFIAMSPALAARTWNVVKTKFDKSKVVLSGSEIDLELLGEDWRALAGVGGFFLSAGEFSTLRPEKRRAIQDWVAQGGVLILCGSEEVADFGKGDGSGVIAYGLGTVRRMDWDGSSELNVAETAAHIQGLPADLSERLTDPSSRWKFGEAIGPASRNVVFLAVFITAFAAVVGPLNLFWFAGPSRRHRLFWTTPLLSIGASVLLGGVILLQDGFGGSGVRMTLRYLQPDDRRVIVMQEQASRTGLLLSRNFSTDERVFLAPAALPSSLEDREGPRTYGQSGRTYGGDWFLSRSAQAQFAQAILPSRETVELVGNAEGAPEVRSSVPAVLTDFCYIDPQGRRWRGQNLRAGERVKLAAAEGGNSVDEVVQTAGPLLRGAFQTASGKPGTFCALAEKAPAIETLPSIRWKAQPVIYVGPVISAP